MKVKRIRVTMYAGGGIEHTSGGVGTLIRYLMDEWDRQPVGPLVRVIDTRGHSGAAGMIGAYLKALLRTIGLAVTGRLGIMHIHMNAYGSTLRKAGLVLLGTVLRRTVILHLHGADFQEFHRKLPSLGKRAVAFVIRRADAVIVLGNGWRDFLVDEVGVPSGNIAVILNGVPDPNAAKPVPRCAVPRILFLGRLGERKGVPDLIAALACSAMRGRQWTAIIAGDGPVEQYRSIVAQAGLSDRVTLPGWVDREGVHALLREADAFVLPSHHEVMPIAILEALAHSVPIVTTPVGAISEFLKDDETALIVPPGAPEALALAIGRLLDQPELRARLRTAGRSLFLERLDIGAVAARIAALYAAAGSSRTGETAEHVLPEARRHPHGLTDSAL